MQRLPRGLQDDAPRGLELLGLLGLLFGLGGVLDVQVGGLREGYGRKV